MRLFFLCSKSDQLDSETRAMIALLGKFRIEADDVIIISDATKRPSEGKVQEFNRMIERFNNNFECENDERRISDSELLAQKEKTNFYLRISEVTTLILKDPKEALDSKKNFDNNNNNAFNEELFI